METAWSPEAQMRRHDALAYWFIGLISVRTMTEGIDYYLGSPLSIITTALLAVVSIAGTFRARMSRTLMPFVRGSTVLIACALATFAITASVEPSIQAQQLLKYVSYVFVFLFCATHRWSLEHIRSLLRAFCIIMLLQLAFSLFQVATSTGFNEGSSPFSRAFGLTSHPLPFSYMIFCEVVFVFLYRRVIARIWSILFFVSAFVALYLTLSRTGWVMVALWVLLMWSREHHPTVKVFSMILLTPILIGVLFYTGRFDDLSTMPQFIANHHYESFDWRFTTNSYEWRLAQWYNLLKVGAQAIWLGHGLGTTPFLNQFDLKAHNSFIDMFVEGGLFGVGSFALFLSGTVQVMRRCVKRPVLRDGIPVESLGIHLTYRASAYSLALGYILAMALASSLFNNPLMMYLWYLNLGFICNLPMRSYLAQSRLRPHRANRLAPAIAYSANNAKIV